MVFEAADALGLDLRRSWLIGDKGSDMECAGRAGVRPVLVRTGYGAETAVGAAVTVAADFASAVESILGRD
jgi:D-glycero-D-manno-heptose 1,7-bisphosphate phosphatase